MKLLFNFYKIIGAILLLLVMAVACKKDTIPVPPVTAPVPELAVSFSAAGISLQDVDTAYVILKKADNSILKATALQYRNTDLFVLLAGLEDGHYKAELVIETKKQNDGTARQYNSVAGFQIPLKDNIKILSPRGNFDDNWLKRAVLFSANNEAVAIVGMSPLDGFYEVRFKDANWKSADLQRSAIHGNVLVADQSHHRDVNGLLSYASYTAFDPFVHKMEGKLWTKCMISLFLEGVTGNEVYLDYEYTR